MSKLKEEIFRLTRNINYYYSILYNRPVLNFIEEGKLFRLSPFYVHLLSYQPLNGILYRFIDEFRNITLNS